ncbi:MAG: 3-deoxy-7-phosphoheptulonate synthase [Candidatus Scalinduaceae bacterium]
MFQYNEPGNVTLIYRFGGHQIEKCLSPLIEAVQQAGKVVLWICGPMHGNNQKTLNSIKTRNFNHILSELEQAFKIHQLAGSYLGGVHFELTCDNVTECVGGARSMSEADLTRAYKTLCDPRLNYEQSLEMVIFIAKHMVGMDG